MPKHLGKGWKGKRKPEDRLARFMRHIEPEIERAEKEQLVKGLVRGELLPSFLKWPRELMAVEIQRRALQEMQALGRLTRPIRAASFYQRKQEITSRMAEHLEILYKKRGDWPPKMRLTLLTELKRGLLEANRELREQGGISLNEKLDNIGKWKKRGLKIDKKIEEAFLEEANKTFAETQKSLINSLLPSINKKIAAVQKEIRQG